VDLDCAAAFVLDRGRIGGALSLEPRDDNLPSYELAVGEIMPAQPVRFAIRGRQKVGDVVGTGFAGLDLVSPRMVRCLTEHGFTGWRTFPVRIEGQRAPELAGFAALSVTGRCGPIDYSMSETVVLPPPVPEGRAMPHRRGLFPLPGSWDGSDLFTPEDTLFTCVTARVRDALIALGAVGVAFVAMSELTMLLTSED
jgi:hypothetical protein